MDANTIDTFLILTVKLNHVVLINISQDRYEFSSYTLPIYTHTHKNVYCLLDFHLYQCNVGRNYYIHYTHKNWI